MIIYELKTISIESVMRKIVYLTFCLFLGIFYSCTKRPKAHGEGPLVGKEFEGYVDCEYTSLYFVSDSEVIAYVRSADFAGHFSDEIKGIYNINDSHMKITWKSVDKRNTRYKDANIFLKTDSVYLSADTIEMFITRYIRRTINNVSSI